MGQILGCSHLAWPHRLQLNSFMQQQQGLVPWTAEGRWDEDCEGESHNHREKIVYWEALCILGSMWKGGIPYRDVKMMYSSTSFCLLIHYFCFSCMADGSVPHLTQFQVQLTLAAPTTVSHTEPPTQILPVRNVPNSLLQKADFVRRFSWAHGCS